MGKVHLYVDSMPEVASLVGGCSDAADCRRKSNYLSLMVDDLQQLEEGVERGDNGMTIPMFNSERVTYSGLCSAETRQSAGGCALKGTFIETTHSMIEGQAKLQALLKGIQPNGL